jgi:predicted nucleotidyltransferase
VSQLDARVSALFAGALGELATRLRRRFGAELIDLRLFGSVARGESHETSDVDVAVVLDQVDWSLRREVIDVATDVGLERGLSISPTLFDRATWERFRAQQRPLVMDIERDGVPL